jgi:rRNA maturation protein Nop10
MSKDTSTFDTEVVEMYKASDSKIYFLKCSDCGKGLQNERHSFLYNPSSQTVTYLTNCPVCGKSTCIDLAQLSDMIKGLYEADMKNKEAS